MRQHNNIDRTVGVFAAIVFAILLGLGGLQWANHNQGKANHNQGEQSLQILNAQADFAIWLIKAEVVNHECRMQNICPPLPPLPKELLTLGQPQK